MNDEWRTKYTAVINSFRWKGLKMRLLGERGHVCGRCGKKAWPLEMHHKTYERLGEELDSDLELLCPNCHKKADEQRADEGRSRASRALHSARFYGWCRAVYGEGYEPDESDWDRFNDWAESRDD